MLVRKRQYHRSSEEIRLLRGQRPPLCACGCGKLVIWSRGGRYCWNKFLNGHCKTTGMTGKHHTAKSKKKISITETGKVISVKTLVRIKKAVKKRMENPEERRKISKALMGRKLSAEHCANVAKALAGKYAGELSSNWQGGISFEPYLSDFNNQLKGEIRKRDNHTCQLCSKTENQSSERLSIHHIDYNKMNCISENLIGLCRSCNGKVNYGRKSWTKYFKRMIQGTGELIGGVGKDVVRGTDGYASER